MISLSCLARAEQLLTRDTRTWEEVTNSFESTPAQNANDGEYDGKRLLELDELHARTYLIGCLSSEKPFDVRLKATGALGWAAVAEAIPALSRLAMDDKEPEKLREAALNPGLRYMKEDAPLKVAIPLARHDNPRIRTAAYWALSGNASDQAVSELEHALDREPPERKEGVIRALNYTGNPRAGTIVLERFLSGSIPRNQKSLRSFVICMNTYRLSEAKNVMRDFTHHKDNLVVLWALQFFGSYPNNDIVEDLVVFIKNKQGDSSDLYDTVIAFLNSPSISEGNKEVLRILLKEKKVTKPRPIQI